MFSADQGSEAPRRLEAALFDLDGLLVDSEPLWHIAEVEVFGSHGVPLTVEMCTETKGTFVAEAVRYWHARYPWESPGIEDVAKEILVRVSELIETRLELKPGALHAIEECRNRAMKLAIASSAPERVIESCVRRLGLEDVFAVYRSAEHEERGKPDPAVFLSAARALGTDPERCLVLEDSLAGVRAAKVAGMLCIAVPEGSSGENSDPLAFVAADVVLGSLAEIDESVWRRLEIAAGETVRATEDYRRLETPAILLSPGDPVLVGERDDTWPAFVKVTDASGAKGWVPERLLVRKEGLEEPMRVLKDGVTYETTELGVELGSILTVLEADLGSGWLRCRDERGLEGWVPVRCLEPVGGQQLR
jgi:mannitol-1-/sugar-/sorbitol-6-/2-deoxyglucose-6-phosphatase